MFKNLMIGLAVFGLFLVVSIGSALGSHTQRPSISLIEERIGKEIAEVLKTPSRVVFAKMTHDENRTFFMDNPRIELNAEQVNKLQKLLFRSEGYHFDRTKKCLFIPDVVFRFETGDEVDAVIAMGCRQIKFISEEKAIILDFDPMAADFSALCQEMLALLNQIQS